MDQRHSRRDVLSCLLHLVRVVAVLGTPTLRACVRACVCVSVTPRGKRDDSPPKPRGRLSVRRGVSEQNRGVSSVLGYEGKNMLWDSSSSENDTRMSTPPQMFFFLHSHIGQEQLGGKPDLRACRQVAGRNCEFPPHKLTMTMTVVRGWREAGRFCVSGLADWCCVYIDASSAVLGVSEKQQEAAVKLDKTVTIIKSKQLWPPSSCDHDALGEDQIGRY